MRRSLLVPASVMSGILFIVIVIGDVVIVM